MCDGACLINALTNIHMLAIRHTLFINPWFRMKIRGTPEKEANTTTYKLLAIFMALSAKNIQLQSVSHIYLYVGINFKMRGSLYLLLYQMFFCKISPEVFVRDSTFAIEW